LKSCCIVYIHDPTLGHGLGRWEALESVHTLYVLLFQLFIVKTTGDRKRLKREENKEVVPSVLAGFEDFIRHCK
jgi:hypothetical protein